VAVPGSWQPGSPELYNLKFKLVDSNGKISDTYEKAIGFRTFVVKGDDFLINDKPVFIRSISRHNIHPDYGMTLPREAICKDLDLALELDCNSIRLPLYPQDTAVLEECDKRGLMTWVEIPVYWDAPLENLKTQQRMHDQMETMMRRDYNHPSVCIWSMANEIDSDQPAVIDCFQKVRDMFSSYEQVRPLTFASWPKDAETNLGMKMVDMSCLNRYRGWYNSSDVHLLAGELDEIKKLYPEHPVFLSEFGAGATAGFHSDTDEIWSEEYQTKTLTEIMNIARKHAKGCSIWVLFDFADPSRVSVKMTNGFYNNKGIITEDRKTKKISFEAVKKLYHAWREEDGI
jgi:beta-glucuronidase